MKRIALLALWVVAPSVARANDDLDQALALYERAEFADAVRAFDRAEAAPSLTRDELEALLRGRALAHDAAGDEGAAERDLAAWLSIRPDATLDESVRPATRRLLERLRGEVVPLRVDAVGLALSTGFDLQARVVGDAAGLVGSVRIVYLDGEREMTVNRTRATIATAAAELRWWAEAIGPGGVVVASAGSRAAPQRINRLASPGSIPVPSDGGGGDDPGPWIGLGVGVGVVVVGVAIVLGVFFGTQTSDTQLGPPTPAMLVMP